LARLRPIDMIPPIWLWALRWSSQKMPTNSATGMSRGSSASKMDGWGLENSTLTSCSRNSARSSSGGSLGPLLENSVPSDSVPVMLPPLFDQVIFSTWSAATLVRSSV
jgi:hypothetical protein